MGRVGLDELETQVSSALAAGVHGQLPIVGFGELSIALALDGGDGPLVAKRMPSFTVDGFDLYVKLIDDYTAKLRSRGVGVTPTEVHGILRQDGRLQCYLVQPRLDSRILGDHLLRQAEPNAKHPVLLAIGETVVSSVDETVSVDAQVTNWGLTGDGLELVDVGTPMLWGSDGQPAMDMKPFLAMLPALTRRPVGSVMSSLMERWKTPEGVLLDALANLHREGLPEWVEPAAAAWSSQLGKRLDTEKAMKMWTDDKRLWPLLTRLKQGERRWRHLRGQPYDFFIQTTMGSSALK